MATKERLGGPVTTVGSIDAAKKVRYSPRRGLQKLFRSSVSPRLCGASSGTGSFLIAP